MTKDTFNIFGDQFNTPDGTCIRDFIHIEDLCFGHIKAIENIKSIPSTKSYFEIFNLGTQKGTTVLNLVKTFEKVNNIKLNYTIVEPRKGDIPVSIAKAEKAKTILNWEANKSIEDMCNIIFQK